MRGAIFSSRPDPIPATHPAHRAPSRFPASGDSHSGHSHSRPSRSWFSRSSLAAASDFLLASLVNTFFQNECLLCGQQLFRFTLHSICEPCLAIVRSTPSDRSPCQRCGASLEPPHEAYPIAAYPYDPRPHLPADPTLPLCGTCQTSPPPFVRAVSAATYRDQFRQVIHMLKYGRRQAVADPLGLMLADAIRTLASEAPRQMLVIPVPLHRRRRRERGFNQARLLAAHALRSLRHTHPDWQLALSPASLVRHRATTPQVELRPAERRVNLERAFHVARPRQVQGRAILLIDDILTTGATARACAQSLLDAGAACVFVATLARAQLTYSNGFWTGSDTDDGLINREPINPEPMSRETIPTLPYPAAAGQASAPAQSPHPT